jgi:predicted Zn-dependent peptidase
MTALHTQVTVLPNRVRVATARMAEMESVAFGIWVGIGGRYESRQHGGISHFLEHLLFKGTRRRTARQISQAIEGVGGLINAFTGEEATCYYAKTSHRFLDIATDVLCDMYRHPRLLPSDIERERSVIKEELLMYRDQPDQYVHEMLGELLWPNHPLGRSITGTPETLDRINRAELTRYWRANYSAANTIVAVAGQCDHADIVARVTKALPFPRRSSRARYQPVPASRQRAPAVRLLTKNVEQTHVALAVRGVSRHDLRRFAVKLLSVILGENMSSRLFQIIREEHGLAYSINSSTTYFDDTGALIISVGLDTKQLHRALRLILRELGRMARSGPDCRELQRAKDYAIGQMRMGLEVSSNQMMWIGEHLLAYNRIPTTDEIEKQVMAVTDSHVRHMAAELFHDHRLHAAIISPSGDVDRLKEILTFR